MSDEFRVLQHVCVMFMLEFYKPNTLYINYTLVRYRL